MRYLNFTNLRKVKTILPPIPEILDEDNSQSFSENPPKLFYLENNKFPFNQEKRDSGKSRAFKAFLKSRVSMQSHDKCAFVRGFSTNKPVQLRSPQKNVTHHFGGLLTRLLDKERIHQERKHNSFIQKIMKRACILSMSI